MEDKMKWAKNYERLQEIQQQLVWPAVTELDPRAFVPDFMKCSLSRQPCERLLASPERSLLHEGYLTLTESAKTVDVYIFLFDDILLITKTKKPQRKKHSLDSNHIKMNAAAQNDKANYTVYRQPMALDRLSLHDVPPNDAAVNGLKNAFVLVQISRYQQVIGVFTLQAGSELSKVMWMEKITEARQKYNSTCQLSRQNSLQENSDQKSDELSAQADIIRTARRHKQHAVLRSPHGKSLSMDAVYL